jgi:hypothetical protein
MSRSPRLVCVALAVLFLGPSACADKAPPARFSDPPPPSLAHPLPPPSLAHPLPSAPEPVASEESDKTGAPNEVGAPIDSVEGTESETSN